MNLCTKLNSSNRLVAGADLSNNDSGGRSVRH